MNAPESTEFLRTLAVVLVIAGATSLLFLRLRLPVVFGYMAAGFLIGPHFPQFPLIADEHMVHELSQLGVILLMFALGLEFSLRKVARLVPTAGVIALAECSLLILLGYLIGQAFGWTRLESIFAGAMIAISSTTIVVKAFEEQKITGPFKEVVLSILIAEDLIAILLLAVLTAISTEATLSAAQLVSVAARLGVFLIGLIVIGLLIVPRTIKYIVGMNRAETTVVTTVGLCFASALIALQFGYSVALGAFLAGALAAESGVAHSVGYLIQPLRDLFAAIFFVAVGMLIQPDLILDHWPAVVVLATTVLLGKFVGVTIGSFFTGHGARTSVQAGLSLAQIGEFSFIIATVGLASGAIRPFLYPVAVAVAAITTITTPALIARSQRFANAIDRALPEPLQTFSALYGSWIESARRQPRREARAGRLLLLLLLDLGLLIVLIIGTVVVMQRLMDLLVTRAGLTADAAYWLIIGSAIVLTIPILLGSFRTTRLLAQRLAGLALPVASVTFDRADAPRRALIAALNLGLVFLSGILVVLVTAPFVPRLPSVLALLIISAVLLLAFWRSATNLQGHARAGAEVVAAALAKQLPMVEEPEPLHHIDDLLPGLGRPTPVRIPAGARAANRSLVELNLRGETGATLLTIRRGEEEIVFPSGNERLQPGDVVVLAGSQDAIAAACELLTHPGNTALHQTAAGVIQ